MINELIHIRGIKDTAHSQAEKRLKVDMFRICKKKKKILKNKIINYVRQGAD